MKMLIAFLLLLAPTLSQGAEKPKGYDAFQLIRTRHIFDPNRKPPKKESDQPRAVTPSRPKSVHLSLTGTMVTEARKLAFFTGSRSEFNKIVGVGEKLGDYTVATITASEVTLDQAGKPTMLGVGKRLQLEGTEADAVESEAAPAAPDGTSAPPAADGSAAPAGGAPSGGSPSDILKRMMERRAKEMKK